MATIPASQIVKVLPGVLAAGGNGLDLNGLMLTDGSGFYPHQTDTSHIRLSFATLSPAQIEAGLKILSRLLS